MVTNFFLQAQKHTYYSRAHTGGGDAPPKDEGGGRCWFCVRIAWPAASPNGSSVVAASRISRIVCTAREHSVLSLRLSWGSHGLALRLSSGPIRADRHPTRYSSRSSWVGSRAAKHTRVQKYFGLNTVASQEMKAPHASSVHTLVNNTTPFVSRALCGLVAHPAYHV